MKKILLHTALCASPLFWRGVGGEAKKILLFTALCVSPLFWRGVGGEALAQYISFPAPELRVDTVKPLNTYGVTFMRPTTQVNKFTIKGNQIPPTFYFQIIDSIGYNRFGVTKNGMVIAGTHHDPQVNVDGLALLGRKNALKGADAFAIGKGVRNLADSTMALGYYYDVDYLRTNAAIFGYGANRFEADAAEAKIIGDRIAVGNISNYANNAVAVGNDFTHIAEKPNTTAIGYGANRIEMDQQGGRFLGNWPGTTHLGTAEPDLPTGQWGWWVNGSEYYIGLDYNNTQQFMKLGSGSGGAETDPIWNAQKSGYMITSPNFAYSESGISGNILPSLTFGRGKIEAYAINTTGQGYKIGFGSSPLSNNITISESGDIDLAGINSRLVLSSSLGVIQLLSENYTTLAANRAQSGTVTRADLTGNGMRYITAGTTSTSLDILSSSIQNESFIWKKYADDNYLSSNQGKIYTQAAEPDIPSNSFGFWVNTTDQTFWIILDSNGTQKKMQLQ